MRLLLLGGGHSHCVFLKEWARAKAEGVELVLCSSHPMSPYSGMLPGVVAGHYPVAEMMIDLQALAKQAGARLVLGHATRISVADKKVYFDDQDPLDFDILSVNIGAKPRKQANEEGFPVKPMSQFLDRLPNIIRSSSVAIIGGGVAGVELSLALKWRFSEAMRVCVIQRDADLLSGLPFRVRSFFRKRCERMGIEIFTGVKDPGGFIAECEHAIWTTSAVGPDILRSSGMTVDEDGFLLTDDRLMVLGESQVFAVGDCARIQGQSRPRAGVYAVRLGHELLRNVLSFVRQEPLRHVKLQKSHLALISLGGKEAVALRGHLLCRLPFLWYVKNGIDLRFVRSFR